jgi:type II secretory pathway pseudopilin PulG
MKFKKNGYTLLEIMIVLWVIIVIMGVTMKFSSSHIDNLQVQTNKDEFKNNYEQLLLNNMSSNYHNEKRYEKLEITMQSWGNWFTYDIQNEAWEKETYTWFSTTKQIISTIIINNEPNPNINIELVPYKIWCKINNEENKEAIIQVKERNKTNCFKITPYMCKLESIICP